MSDTITSRDNHSTAVQAMNISQTMDIVLPTVKGAFRTFRAAIISNDSMIPSRHSREDIKWDQYINSLIR